MSRVFCLLLILVAPVFAADHGICPGGKYAKEEYLFRAEHGRRPFLTICMDGTIWCKHGCDRSLAKVRKQVRIAYHGHRDPGWEVTRYIALQWAPTIVDARREARADPPLLEKYRGELVVLEDVNLVSP